MKRILLIFTSSILGISFEVLADRYQLIWGSQYPLCQELSELITRQEINYPYSCSLPISDNFPNIKKIEWEEVPYEKNFVIDALLAFDKQLYSEKDRLEKSSWFIDAFEENINSGAQVLKGKVQFSPGLPYFDIYKIVIQGCNEAPFEELVKMIKYDPLYYVPDVGELNVPMTAMFANSFFLYGNHLYAHRITTTSRGPGKALTVYEYGVWSNNITTVRACGFELIE